MYLDTSVANLGIGKLQPFVYLAWGRKRTVAVLDVMLTIQPTHSIAGGWRRTSSGYVRLYIAAVGMAVRALTYRWERQAEQTDGRRADAGELSMKLCCLGPRVESG